MGGIDEDVGVYAYRPKNLRKALEIMDRSRVIPFAGGTDLMVSRKSWSGLTPHFEKPVLFIGHLEELKGVKSDKGHLKVGTACTFSSLIESDTVPFSFKVVISQIASPAIRNRATIGGNVCNASPAGDSLPLLYALSASVVLCKKDAQRSLSIDDFISGSGKTVLSENELVKEIIVPSKKFNLFFYRKVGLRRVNSCSKLSFIGFAQFENGIITDVRIAFGSVAPTIIRSRDIETRMIGKTGREIENIMPEISSLYSSLLQPIDDQRCNKKYRRAISLKLLHHFLQNELILKIQ